WETLAKISQQPKDKRRDMNRFCSMFSQILQLFPRSDFQLLVKETRDERHARGFSCWGQFVAMLFYQLGRAHSLREICPGLHTCEPSSPIYESRGLLNILLWRMLTNIVPGNFTSDYFSCCCNVAARRVPSPRSSALKTSLSVWTPR